MPRTTSMPFMDLLEVWNTACAAFPSLRELYVCSKKVEMSASMFNSSCLSVTTLVSVHLLPLLTYLSRILAHHTPFYLALFAIDDLRRKQGEIQAALTEAAQVVRFLITLCRSRYLWSSPLFNTPCLPYIGPLRALQSTDQLNDGRSSSIHKQTFVPPYCCLFTWNRCSQHNLCTHVSLFCRY